MNICWQPHISLETITERCKGTMVEHLGIIFTALNSDTLEATMPVDHRTRSPVKNRTWQTPCHLVNSSQISHTAAKQTNRLCIE